MGGSLRLRAKLKDMADGTGSHLAISRVGGPHGEVIPQLRRMGQMATLSHQQHRGVAAMPCGQRCNSNKTVVVLLSTSAASWGTLQLHGMGDLSSQEKIDIPEGM